LDPGSKKKAASLDAAVATSAIALLGKIGASSYFGIKALKSNGILKSPPSCALHVLRADRFGAKRLTHLRKQQA
jgi:hypothetical protein